MKSALILFLLSSSFAFPQASIGDFSGVRGFQGYRAEQAKPLLREVQHPFRKVGDRYWDLRPLATVPRGQLTNELRAWHLFISPTVYEVHPEGYLLKNGTERIVLLRNFPGPGKANGELLNGIWVALESGTWQYRTIYGQLVTVRAYDYGTPYDPWEKARQAEASRKK